MKILVQAMAETKSTEGAKWLAYFGCYVKRHRSGRPPGPLTAAYAHRAPPPILTS